ncbi:MAG: hypothetical protein VX498_06660, partial [Myxococcota bacterium]|nr:hypothetical protein [Myxococcota bacterium]
MRRSWALASLAALLLVPAGSQARRLPSSQAQPQKLHVDEELWREVVEAHVTLPLLEPARITDSRGHEDRSRHPVVRGRGVGAGVWSSPILRTILKNDDSTRWTLTPTPQVKPAELLREVQHCLGPEKTKPWPGRVLALLGLSPSFEPAETGSSLDLHFPKAVGALPELLAGCRVRLGEIKAPYEELEGDQLKANPGPGSPKLKHLVRSDTPEQAVLSVSPSNRPLKDESARYPEVLVLVPGPVWRSNDPFGLDKLSDSQRAVRLSTDKLIEALLRDHGSMPTHLLPPGLGGDPAKS